VLQIAAGTAAGDPSTAPPLRAVVGELDVPPRTLRIGVYAPERGHFGPIDPEILSAVEAVVTALDTAGHHVDRTYPRAFDEPDELAGLGTVFDVGFARHLDRIGGELGVTLREEDVEPWTWASAGRGKTVSAPEYVAAVDGLQRWTRRAAKWWADGVDLLITPTLSTLPPPLGHLAPTVDLDELARRFGTFSGFTHFHNVTGQPAISVPVEWSRTGLPIGVQLVAAFGKENLLLRVARQLEQQFSWQERQPPTHA